MFNNIGPRSLWDEAKASNKDESNQTFSRSAEKYSISLKKIGGQYNSNP
jgi:hypothetical protein